MIRRDIEANHDFLYAPPNPRHNPQKNSVFLRAPPGQRVKATFLFTRKDGAQPPQTADITIGHYARPAMNTPGMAPAPSRIVTFTAAFSGQKVQP